MRRTREAVTSQVSRKVEQSRETQERLISVARALFAERGYAGTSTEDIVAHAGVTRGALYHQYVDKRDLFRAVFQSVEEDVGRQIAEALTDVTDPWELFARGMEAFLDTCLDPAVRRIVLVDGPSVLGWEEWRRIDEQYSLRQVSLALQINVQAGNLPPGPLTTIAHLFVGALNEAGLAVAAGGSREEFGQAFRWLLDRLRVQAAS